MFTLACSPLYECSLYSIRHRFSCDNTKHTRTLEQVQYVNTQQDVGVLNIQATNDTMVISQQQYSTLDAANEDSAHQYAPIGSTIVINTTEQSYEQVTDIRDSADVYYNMRT